MKIWFFVKKKRKKKGKEIHNKETIDYLTLKRNQGVWNQSSRLAWKPEVPLKTTTGFEWKNPQHGINYACSSSWNSWRLPLFLSLTLYINIPPQRETGTGRDTDTDTHLSQSKQRDRSSSSSEIAMSSTAGQVIKCKGEPPSPPAIFCYRILVLLGFSGLSVDCFQNILSFFFSLFLSITEKMVFLGCDRWKILYWKNDFFFRLIKTAHWNFYKISFICFSLCSWLENF